MSRILLRFEAESPEARTAHVTIDNAAKLNTLTPILLEELTRTLGQLAGDAGLRAIVLAGSGKRAFIGGADIGTMAALDPATAPGFIGLIHDCCRTIRGAPMPVIARLDGFVLGAGMEIAAACDLRIAAATAQFGMPEVKLGIPSVVEAALLPGLIGWGRTRQMLLLGELYSAKELEAWGFLNLVTSPDELDAGLETVLQALYSAGPQAVQQQKRLIAAWEDLALSEAIDAGVPAFAAAFASDEPQRLMRAFQARRHNPET
jgi:enoyl-CoA hydratase